jgi:hypothetical protein
VKTDGTSTKEVERCSVAVQRGGRDSSAAGKASLLAAHPVTLLLGLGLLAVIVNVAMRWQWPLPFCVLRKLTGVPCPACGSTRSLLAWTHLDPVAAFLFNPLFFLACAGVAVWAAALLCERISARPVLVRWRSSAQQLPLLRIILGLAAINWIYLCLTLPK